MGVARQTSGNKKLIHPSELWHFQGFREQKTAYCTEPTIVYPSIPSALRPVKTWRFPTTSTMDPAWRRTTSTSPEDKPVPSCSNVDPDFPELTEPHLILQCELNDLVRDLHLLKIQAELMAFRLQGWNLLQQGVKI